MRDIQIGDKGKILGVLSHPMSGLATLLIDVKGKGKSALHGDWRMITRIYDDLERGALVEVGDDWVVYPVCPTLPYREGVYA